MSKWLQRRCPLQTALLDVTIDRTDEEIDEQFSEIPNAVRTALAFAKQANTDGALALLNRYAGRHSREWHKAVDKLRTIQKKSARKTNPRPLSFRYLPPGTGRVSGRIQRIRKTNPRPG